MRVLFWSETFWPQIGGVEVLAAKLLPALRARGHEYAVVTPKSHPDLPDEETFAGIPVHRFHFSNNLNQPGVDHVAEIRQKVITLKRSFAPNLIHLNHLGWSNFFHVITNQAYPAPTLVTLHGEWPDKTNAIVDRTLQTAAWVTGCSEAILSKARTLTPEITARSSVIHNGIDRPHLNPSPLPYDPPRLLCLGRLAVEKGFDLALTAFTLVVRRFPQARLIFAGDGPERHELEQMTRRFNLSGSVSFIGWVPPDKVPETINESTMVIIPSRLESLPLVALQAGTLMRPVVASSVGGIPEVVLHGESGLLVESENSQALAGAMLFLLEHRDRARSLGRAAATRVHRLFDWQRHVDAYDALYRQLSSTRGHS